MLSWFSIFKKTGKKSVQYQAPEVTFLYEQDGPPERLLKEKLTEMFSQNETVERAYLAMARLGSESGVVLGLATRSGPDEKIVTNVQAAFASECHTNEHLDIVFLTTNLEAQLTKVCRPFFAV
jgi:hypothetical protein